MYWCIGVGYAIFILVIVIEFARLGPKEAYSESVIFTLLVFYSILLICYSATLIKMNRAMKLLLQSEIQTERCSVLLQFGLFIGSFATRVVFFTAEWKKYSDKDPPFWFQMLSLIFYLPWNWLPVTYILWCHQRTYQQTDDTHLKEERIQLSNDLNAREEVISVNLCRDESATGSGMLFSGAGSGLEFSKDHSLERKREEINPSHKNDSKYQISFTTQNTQQVEK